MYEYRGPGDTQIGLLNAVIVSLGYEPQAWLTIPIWNNIFLMAIIVLCNIGLSFIPESNKERFQNMANMDASSSNVGSLVNASYLFAALGALCFLVGQFFDKTWFTNGGLSFIVVAKINFEWGGGSSSVFNNALKALLESMCTSSIM